jgi:triacylglycerol esterase/lipase EstA (alpha/beta hydrolase family)
MRRAALAVLTLALLGLFAVPATAATSSGYNDWTCKPSAAHPRPVVLIHGLGGTGEGHWTWFGPQVAGQGYCVYSFTYGQPFPGAPIGGTKPVADSAKTVGAFIDKVRASTGVAKVDLVGHSEGGFLSLYVPKKVPGAAGKVDTVVSLAPPTHGTSFGGLVTIGKLLGGQAFIELLTKGVQCFACSDLVDGGAAVKELTAGPIAQSGIDYTVIATRFDALVTPTSTSFVDEPGVDNSYVQDTCRFDPVGHIGMAFDTTVLQLATNALDPRTAVDVKCGYGPPF